MVFVAVIKQNGRQVSIPLLSQEDRGMGSCVVFVTLLTVEYGISMSILLEHFGVRTKTFSCKLSLLRIRKVELKQVVRVALDFDT